MADAEVQTRSQPRKPTWKDLIDNRRVLAWCLVIYILPINFGFEINVTGNLIAVPAFLDRFGVETADGSLEIKATDQQLLNAATTVGLFVSAFATGFLSDKLGRRNVVLAACVISIAGIFVQAWSTSIAMLFGGKIISTFGYGLGHSLGPVYVAELAPPILRGTMLSLVNTMIVIGQWTCSLGVYAASFRKGDSAWRVPLLVQLIPPAVLFIIALPFLPESPSLLIMRGKREAAAKALRIFNGPRYNVEEAITTLELTIQHEHELLEQKSSYLDCFTSPNGRRTLIICMVYIAQQFIGVNFIAGYLAYYFQLAGVDNALGIAQAAYAIQLFGNICSWPLIDRFGRRPLIVHATILMTALLLVIGGISTPKQTPASLKATVALMTIWGFLYQASLGPAAYSVGGETASPRVRQKTYSINIMTATAVSCLVLQVMPYLLNKDEANLGGKICFVFFAPSVLMCVYLYYCFPEMKGRNYLELEEMFQERLPARKFKDYVCAANIELAEVMNTKSAVIEQVEVIETEAERKE
ncbi:Major facilitator-type transporter ecdC [Pseudocercospora fuligena]|uniref:Major facilitator-type transporter ecdC n=1 Tax=Pseudocercospora fuligena TaxID=685502 RepID=A0A8H6R6S3_9PEZI|nr:Major facilitator-type transporter ecdC [Pseudocercospora fuligena]